MFKMTKKQMIVLLLLASVIVTAESLQVLFVAKDGRYLEDFRRLTGGDKTLSDFISFLLFHYFTAIFGAVAVSVYTFLTRDRWPINVLYKGVFSLLIVISLIYKIFSLHYRTVPHFISVVTYIILLFYLLGMKRGLPDGKVNENCG